MSTFITRDNIDQLLDAHKIEICAPNANGRWYTIRRNGQTRRWKRDPERISVPCKVGFRDCFRIEHGNFWFLPDLDHAEAERVRYTYSAVERLRCALDPRAFRVRE